MDVSGLSSYLDTQYANASSSVSANSATSSISSISSDSSEEEITEAVKSFESYFVEQVIKQVKESFLDEESEDEDGTMSMYKDYFMDSAISEVASELVDEIGESTTDDFVQQIMRNYGITATIDTEEEEVDSETQATVATAAVEL